MIRYLLAWFPMLLLAIANGAFRQVVLARMLSEPRAHQVSTLTGAILIGAFIGLLIRRWPPASRGQALRIGLLWALLTLGFETFMGLVLQHRSLAQVLQDYNLLAGRVWILFLVWLALAPWCFFRLGTPGAPERLPGA